MIKNTLKTIALTVLLGTMCSAATLATVNGTKITSEEVYKELMEGTQGSFNELPKEKQEEVHQRLMSEMIMLELIYDDAKKSGVLESKEYKEELENVLKRIKKRLVAKIWEKKQFDEVAISEKELKDYYDEHSQEIVEKPKAHARHILVQTEAKANELISRLTSLSGEKLKTKFIELAIAESVGPSAPKGGDLGFFPEGQMVPEFNDAAFKMEVGTITTSPVQSQFGYHIIYLEEKKEGRKLSYEEVKGFIEQQVKVEKFKAVMNDKMKSLKESAKITYGE